MAHCGELTRLNPDLAEDLMRLTTGLGVMAEMEEIEPNSAVFRMDKKAFMLDVVIALVLRMNHLQVYHFWPAVLSIYAYRCHLPQPFWEILSRVEKYNNYHGFYDGVIGAIAAYLAEIVPPLFLNNPKLLLVELESKKCKGAACLSPKHEQR